MRRLRYVTCTCYLKLLTFNLVSFGLSTLIVDAGHVKYADKTRLVIRHTVCIVVVDLHASGPRLSVKLCGAGRLCNPGHYAIFINRTTAYETKTITVCRAAAWLTARCV